MTVRSVHWHEGMFLWPQQMQQAERFYAHQVHLSGTWDTHYNWGLRAVEVDLKALSNSRLLVRVLRARLRYRRLAYAYFIRRIIECCFHRRGLPSPYTPDRYQCTVSGHVR